MGVWGSAAWDNDYAADWYAGLFDESKLRERVRAALEQDVFADEFYEVRAAAHLVVLLSRVYVWPIKALKDNLVLAHAKLCEIKDVLSKDRDTVGDEMIAEIDRDIAVLDGRIKN